MSRTLTYTVPPAWDGRTVKDFARQHLGLSSRAFVKQKYLPGGLVKNGQPCRSVDLLRAGDRLCLTLPQDAETYQAVEGPLSILYEDQDYLAVDKPPAMPVHPSPGHDRDSLLNRVAFHYQRTGQAPAFRPLYRLDKDTSGILLVGKHRAAVSSAQVEKTYYAVCQGELSGDGTVEAPIGLEPGSKIRRCCREDGQPAHQIRVHMAHLGHPLAGDDLYGGSRQRLCRQALHCGELSLVCKPLGAGLRLAAPFPEDMAAAFPWILPFSPAL